MKTPALSTLILLFALTTAMGQTSPHGTMKLACSTCHTTDSWTMRVNATFDHASTGFPLGGAHKAVACASCHAKLVFAGTPSTCTSCHTDVHRGELGSQCQRCHEQKSWQIVDMRQRHQQTRFPLVGVHAATPCERCHKPVGGQQYAGTSIRCIGCHRDEYVATVSPAHTGAGFSTDCAQCHKVSGTAWGGTFDHALTAFPLTGAHRATICSSCHTANKFKGTTTQCSSCHAADFTATTSPNHTSAGFPQTCTQCHSTTAWSPSSYDHGTTAFALTGAHRTVACSQCHVNGQFAGTAKTCNVCHATDFANTTAPNHAAASFPQTCQTCHSTTTWSPSSFDHSTTAFVLTGSHLTAACAQCHVNGQFAGTSTTCSVCHGTDYTNTTSPHHTAPLFPQTCQTCHSTTAWSPAAFDHATTTFPLVGAHLAVVCTQCHTNNQYAGTSHECIACHQSTFTATTSPPHVSLSFPNTCLVCHSMAGWKPATFDHTTSRFPLTGAHTSVVCASCHVNNNYQIVYTDCFACHQSDYAVSTKLVHSTNQLSHACESCHTTTVWTPSTFNHDASWFRILDSGKHRGRWSTCMTCHPTPGNYTTFTCLTCHEHEKTETDGHHNGVSGYVYASPNCYSCHRNV